MVIIAEEQSDASLASRIICLNEVRGDDHKKKLVTRQSGKRTQRSGATSASPLQTSLPSFFDTKCTANELTTYCGDAFLYPHVYQVTDMLKHSLRPRTPAAWRRFHRLNPLLGVAALNTQSTRPTGDISSVFPSLSGTATPPLPDRFASLKQRLISGHEDAVRESWHRLLADLRRETEVIRSAGSSIVPEISFSDIKHHNTSTMTEFRDCLKKRGVAIIRGVVTEQEALGWKELVKRYIQMNPSVTGTPTLLLSFD